MAKENKKYIIGTDTGGTFTDIAVLSQAGDIYIDKAPTTPKDFSEGIMEAVSRVSSVIGIAVKEMLENCVMFKHGTTVATNALINRHGSKVGLITTKGFEDTTLIMRAIGRVAGLGEEELKHQATAVKPEPIVPRRLIRGVYERVDYSGEVIVPLNIEDARQAIKYLVEDNGVEAIAVNFLWGFANPMHENMVKKLIEEEYGDRGLYVTTANELVPVIREYARSNTVVINGFLGKTVDRYLGLLEQKLGKAGYKNPLLVMQANGGIVHKEEMAPVRILESGPCGGMTASKFIADLLGHSNVITTDMGGTSYDVGLLVDGYWRYKREPVVERFHITVPMIDIESIGAGGGTMAWIEPSTKRLMVGPKSAGADPGPVCYGAGGTGPTVTDADVILGYIDPGYFLGGKMKLNKEIALKAMKEKIAGPLGLDPVKAAAGIYDIVNNHMADLIRKQVVTTGSIPREFVLYSFGGAGPVHAIGFGAELGVQKIYVFPTSAVFSAFGIAEADIVHTYAFSERFRLPVKPEELNEPLEEIESKLASIMEREGFKRKDIIFKRTFHMRYRRQLNEIAVHVPTKIYDSQDILKIIEEFDKRYEEVYGEGSAYREAGVDIISISIDAIGPTPKPAMKSYPFGGEDPSASLKGGRKVYFTRGINDFIDTKIYDFLKLKPGNLLAGPAICETPITTIVIPPGHIGHVDKYLNIELKI